MAKRKPKPPEPQADLVTLHAQVNELIGKVNALETELQKKSLKLINLAMMLKILTKASGVKKPAHLEL